MTGQPRRIGLFVPSLRGGGAERVMVNLARGFANEGWQVDLVLAMVEGPYLSQIPPGVRVINLNVPRVLASVPPLVSYLRRERPAALVSALDHANLAALLAQRLAGVPSRVVVSVHSTLSQAAANATTWRKRVIPRLAQRLYPWAHAVIAVSHGVAEDLARTIRLPVGCIHTIYNPVVTQDLLEQSKERLDHPWFNRGQPPVVLSVGRLTAAKDHRTLIRAFSYLRKDRPARLMILGEGRERQTLEVLIRELGLEADVALPGFVENPYAYMARAAVFVLSSAWEGFSNVLVEAMAVGTPVVSTDCPNGPAEILEGGRWGKLVRVNDPESLAKAIASTIDNPPSSTAMQRRAMHFSVEAGARHYLEVLQLDAPAS